MLLGAARVHAAALRLRAQLRRAARAPGRAGPRPERGAAATSWPRSSTRPTSTCVADLGAGRRPGARHRAAPGQGACWSSPRASAATSPPGGRRRCSCSLDGADANTATHRARLRAALVAAERTPTLLRERWRAGRERRAGIDYEPRVWYNPELRSTQFLVPGLIGFILMLTAVLSTALSVVREKERGTMEQLRVTLAARRAS